MGTFATKLLSIYNRSIARQRNTRLHRNKAFAAQRILMAARHTSAGPAPLAPAFFNPAQNILGIENAILSGTSSRHYVPDYETPLSIKTVAAGSVVWETPGRRYVVHENTYLVLNDGQRYSMTMDSHAPSTTFCIFFQRGFVEAVYRARNSRVASLLDAPDQKSGNMTFRERLEPAPARALSATRQFHAALRRGHTSRTGAEEAFLAMAEALVRDQQTAMEAPSRLAAARAATREELYRRVSRGRDFLLSSLDEPVTLRDAARAACLSSYHFLRAFRDAFGQTPHQFLTRQRLERARMLLARGQYSVTEVCLESGFQSLGSFSSLFRRQFGASPRQFQRSAGRLRLY
jgi:AraC family transcriptional regulator